ncbi:hypothetical protein PO878_21150 [Iamia majanohamensis]|uniref:Uncharacterized protein n=1 Tax=Iamia majanohamensis TaxID=467976 RepID=A0AAE9Y9E3_9ACTN|nr:hypothetical protein [Iamia majanohamensis]WCO67003.1 hypothetical protein PO878_21150 [Iamia majanohamensis]
MPSTPTQVWASADGAVRVLAVGVHHEPVPDCVAYRVETPDGVVVISGDTRVCSEVGDLAVGADVLVHEACRTTALAEAIAGTTYETIFSYHADTVPLGALAQRSGVPHVVLTHLIPPPDTPEQAEGFAQDLRDGGYGGTITVGEDLTTAAADRDHLVPVKVPRRRRRAAVTGSVCQPGTGSGGMAWRST